MYKNEYISLLIWIFIGRPGGKMLIVSSAFMLITKTKSVFISNMSPNGIHKTARIAPKSPNPKLLKTPKMLKIFQLLNNPKNYFTNLTLLQNPQTPKLLKIFQICTQKLFYNF